MSNINSSHIKYKLNLCHILSVKSIKLTLLTELTIVTGILKHLTLKHTPVLYNAQKLNNVIKSHNIILAKYLFLSLPKNYLYSIPFKGTFITA